MPPKPLFTFCHIEKCGGTTLIALLRRNLSWRHIDIIPSDKNSNLAHEADIATAMRLNPFVCSITGHGLRPYGEYGAYTERMVWYTILREPIARMCSDYKNDCRARGFVGSLTDWAQFPSTHNFMTRSLSASGELEEAKDVLQNRFAYFGLLDEFDECLGGIRELFLSHPFALNYSVQNRAEESSLESRRGTNFGRAITPGDLLAARDANNLDLELWKFARELKHSKSPARVREGREVPVVRKNTPMQNARLLIHGAIRNFIYKPMVGVMPGEIAALPRSHVNVKEYAAKTAGQAPMSGRKRE
jgi:hypothetical protein